MIALATAGRQNCKAMLFLDRQKTYPNFLIFSSGTFYLTLKHLTKEHALRCVAQALGAWRQSVGNILSYVSNYCSQ